VYITVCILCDSFNLNAQTCHLHIKDSGVQDTLVFAFQSKPDAVKRATEQYWAIVDNGYLLATADTFFSDSVMRMNIIRNRRFLLGDIYVYDGRDEIAHHRVKKNFIRPVLNSDFSKILSDYENQGYPFASLRMDSLQCSPKGEPGMELTDAFVTLLKGPRIVNDSLYIRSTSSLPYIYLKRYVDFKEGGLYSEERMKQAERRLREIPFVLVKRPPEVRFREGKADLFLFAERKKANYFNGIAGVRPDEITGKINVTGDAEIRLMNALNRGEELGVVWRKLQSLTQDLSVKAMVPYLLKSPIAVDGAMKIYKRDTAFTSVKLVGGLGVLLPRSQRIRAFVERSRSDQLTQFYTAGSIANARHTLYGLSAQLEALDYRWNPSRGYSLFLEGATGLRETSVPQGEFTRVANRPLSRTEAQIDLYLPTFTKQTIFFSLKGAAIWSDSLYENEAYRIGGLRTIRGINEESIFATAWCVGTIEYRWLPEENSAIYVFIDQAWYEYKSLNGYLRDIPISAGIGFNVDTRAGIFTFNYALGSQFDNPVLVRNGKISFGFRSLF
jgi:outer membrane protein assembly factor BamA